MTALLLATLAHAGVTGADHQAQFHAEQMEWSSQIRLDTWLKEDLELELVAPLPPETALISSTPPSEFVRDEQGRPVALRVTQAGMAYFVRTQIRTPGDALHPPLLMDAPQRIVLEGAYYEPDAALEIRRTLRHQSQDRVDFKDQQSLRREFGRLGRGVQPIYVMGDARLAQGLTGEIRESGERRSGAAAVTAGIFAGVIALMGMLYRLVDGIARRERQSDAKVA